MVQDRGCRQAAQVLQPGPPRTQERECLDTMPLVSQALTNGRDVRANVTARSQQKRNQDQRQTWGQLQGIRGQGLHPNGSLATPGQISDEIQQNLRDLTASVAMNHQEQGGALHTRGLR